MQLFFHSWLLVCLIALMRSQYAFFLWVIYIGADLAEFGWFGWGDSAIWFTVMLYFVLGKKKKIKYTKVYDCRILCFGFLLCSSCQEKPKTRIYKVKEWNPSSEACLSLAILVSVSTFLVAKWKFMLGRHFRSACWYIYSFSEFKSNWHRGVKSTLALFETKDAACDVGLI